MLAKVNEASMAFYPLDFSQPIPRDYYYLSEVKDAPSIEVRTVNKVDRCIKIRSEYFNPGLHVVITSSHANEEELVKVSDDFKKWSIEQVHELYVKVLWDIQFYQACLGKLTLAETHVYATTIISHAIACELKLKMKLKERIKALSNIQ